MLRQLFIGRGRERKKRGEERKEFFCIFPQCKILAFSSFFPRSRKIAFPRAALRCSQEWNLKHECFSDVLPRGTGHESVELVSETGWPS